MPLEVDNFRHALGLRGSPRRDAFKHAHKAQLGPGFWATDLDLVLVGKEPTGIVAFLDCKQPAEPLSFAEVIAYNALLAVAPMYVIEVRDPDAGPFTIKRYRGGDWHPSPPRVDLEWVTVCTSWEALKAWEQQLRNTAGRGTQRL